MDELLNEFLTETNESIAVLDVELVELEQKPDSPELLANIFRPFTPSRARAAFLACLGSKRWRTCAMRSILGSGAGRMFSLTAAGLWPAPPRGRRISGGPRSQPSAYLYGESSAGRS